MPAPAGRRVATGTFRVSLLYICDKRKRPHLLEHVAVSHVARSVSLAEIEPHDLARVATVIVKPVWE